MQDDDSKTEVSDDASTGTGDGSISSELLTDIPATPARVKTRRSALWHLSHTIGRMVSAALTVVLMVCIAAVLRIASGGLDIAPLKPYIDEELDRQNLADLIAFESLVLHWDDQQNDLDLVANNVRISVGRDTGNPQNMVLVPNVEVGIDLAQILEGKFRVKELTLSGIYLSVNRDESGNIDLNVGLSEGSDDFGDLYADNTADQTSATILARLQFLLDQWTQRQGGNALLAKLDRISITNGWLNFHDQKEDRQYLARDLQIGAHRFADRIMLTGSGGLYIAQDSNSIGDPSLEMQAVYNPDKSFDLDLAVERLHTAHLRQLLPNIKELDDIDLPVSATVKTTIAADGTPAAADFRILGENGLLRRADLFPRPLVIQALAIDGTADWQARR